MSAKKVAAKKKPAKKVAKVETPAIHFEAVSKAPNKPDLEKQEPILRARELTKRYGTVVALNGADFDLYPGEILGVIGDNGAGKSTLIKALCGAVTPDHGEILLDGKPVHFRTPQDASNAGIETVHHEPCLVAGPVNCRQHVPWPRDP